MRSVMSGFGTSILVSELASTVGPSFASSSPSAKCAAAGEKMSRPWNVAETGSSAYSRFVISYAASIPPSFSAAGTSNPLSGPT